MAKRNRDIFQGNQTCHVNFSLAVVMKMIAANKYQTGFDQPKLCAMYVDKKLQGVDCVQTLSRLNRTFGDSKPTFILDFFNDPQDILDAFLPYYTKAELTDVTDPQLIYDLQKKLEITCAAAQYHTDSLTLSKRFADHAANPLFTADNPQYVARYTPCLRG